MMATADDHLATTPSDMLNMTRASTGAQGILSRTSPRARSPVRARRLQTLVAEPSTTRSASRMIRAERTTSPSTA